MSCKRDRSPSFSQRPRKKVLYQGHPRNRRDWAGLSCDLLRLVLEKLISLRDYIRFGAVCRDWQSLLLEDYKDRSLREEFWQNQQLPLLLLPPSTTQSSRMRNRGFFYSLPNQNVLINPRPIRPHSRPKRFIGSSFGWLILLDDCYKITLYNPFKTTNHTICIDCSLMDDIVKHREDNFDTQGNFEFDMHRVNHSYFVCKAVLSADPALSPNDYAVVLIYGLWKRVAFIRPSVHRAWCHAVNLTTVEDIHFNSFDGSFFGLLGDGKIVTFSDKDLSSQHMPVYEVAPGIPLEPVSTQVDNCGWKCLQAYMVETSKKDLLQIRRFGIVKVDNEKGSFVVITTYFQVFKCRPDSSGWDELKSLGDDILFLGDNNALAVRASDFLKCRPGSIYYTFIYNGTYMALEKPYSSDDPMDMGIYTLETRRFYPFNIHLTGGWCDAMARQPPIWIVPPFQTSAS